MVVNVRFVGALRGMSGRSKFSIDVVRTVRLREIIKKIGKEFPQIARAIIDPELEDSRPSALILVNGKEISVFDGLETKVKDGDEVVFIPVIHGG